MEREHLKGTIKLWPGVAEEELGSKAFYIKAGLFKDVDAVLFCQVASNFGVSYGPCQVTGWCPLSICLKARAHTLLPHRGVGVVPSMLPN